MSSPSIYDADPHRPIFVLGALRSGTTVFRLMLDAHKEINPIEFDFAFDPLNKISKSSRWGFDLEKLRLDRKFQAQNLNIIEFEDGKDIVMNFIGQLRQRTRGHLTLNIHRNLDKVAAIFPDAKIIHIVRDPRDVARSSIGMGWAGNTYFGVDHWLETENGWDRFARLFDEKNILQFHYEDLISNPREQLGKICEFIGAPFLPEMLSYPAHSTYGAPDPSAVQQWKTKLSPREIALVEIKAKHLMLDRGYELSGHPLEPPGYFEKSRLFWANKLYKWKFGCRRYGLFNFIMEKITRRLVKPLNFIFVHRINEIAKQHYK
jgi:Sulfotransferase family